MELACELFDLAGKSGGKEEGLPVVGHLFHDLAHGREEAHIEHTIGLIHDEDFEPAHIDVTLFHEIHEAAWSGDDDFSSVLEGLDLRLLAHASVDGGKFHIEVEGVVDDIVADLGDQLAGGRNYEGADSRGFWFDVTKDSKHRKGEGCGLAGAGLGDADDVLSPHDDGDGLALDGRGLGISGVLNRIENGLGELEVGECHRGSAKLESSEKTAN